MINIQTIATTGWETLENVDCGHGHCHLHTNGQSRSSVSTMSTTSGYANLFVRGASGHVDFVAVVESSSAVAVPDDDLSGPDGVPGPGATIGTFLAYLHTKPNGVTLSADAVGHPATAQEPKSVEFAGA